MNTSETLDILGRHFDGDVLERLMDLASDGTADMEPGELAALGMAMSELSARIQDTAKAAVEPRIAGMLGADASMVSAGVRFEWRRETTATMVDVKAVRDAFPRSEYPHLYKEMTRPAHIRVRRDVIPDLRIQSLHTSIVEPPPAKGSTTMLNGSVYEYSRFSRNRGSVLPGWLTALDFLPTVIHW